MNRPGLAGGFVSGEDGVRGTIESVLTGGTRAGVRMVLDTSESMTPQGAAQSGHPPLWPTCFAGRA